MLKGNACLVLVLINCHMCKVKQLFFLLRLSLIVRTALPSFCVCVWQVCILVCKHAWVGTGIQAHGMCCLMLAVFLDVFSLYSLRQGLLLNSGLVIYICLSRQLPLQIGCLPSECQDYRGATMPTLLICEFGGI